MVDAGYVSKTFSVIQRTANWFQTRRARLRYGAMFCAGAITTLALPPARVMGTSWVILEAS